MPKTPRMGVKYGKGAQKKAIKLHSIFVRTRANFVCEHCGSSVGDIHPRTGNEVKQMQCAHIITRRAIGTVTDERNAYCLCASCHWRFGKWPIEFARFVFDTIGEHLYDELSAKAMDSIGVKVDWDAEVDRLQELLDETIRDRGVPS